MQRVLYLAFFAREIHFANAAISALTVLPTVEFAKLISNDYSFAVSTANSLVTIGAVQIHGIPNFLKVRKEAMESFAECMSKNKNEVESRKMFDGSLRLTAQAASMNGVPGVMSSECGESSSNLRVLVDTTTRQLFLALDNASESNPLREEQLLMAPYKSFDQLMRHGQHLEHMHAYYGADTAATGAYAEQTNSTTTVDFHTDAGLLIAMTAGYYTGRPASEVSGLYIELPTGVRARVVLDDDALIVMVGEGGARWLSPVVGASLRAVPHALVADLAPGSSRSWFGKMYLPPGDAVVPQEGLAYDQYRAIQNKALVSRDLTMLLPSACEGTLLPSGTYSAHRLVESTTCTAADGTTGINCWTICMSVTGLSCGTNAECVNPEGDITPPAEHCESCMPSCTWNIYTNSTTFDGYCYGTGVSMYMDGFTSITSSDDGSTACVNLLFVEFTLDSKVKFAFACIGVLLLGLLVQYLTKLRSEVAKRPTSTRNNMILVVMNALQVTLGYFLMLAAMTYSIELFSMVCLGLSFGFAVFNLKTPVSAITDPCCAGESEEESDDSSGLEASLMKNEMGVVVNPLAVN